MDPHPVPAPAKAEATRLAPAALNSWKEIATYMGRGVRTVQRWERELGLPVRRPHNHLRSPVIALPAELDEWMRRGQPRRGGSRRDHTTSDVAKKSYTLCEKIKTMCERTQQLSQNIARTLAQANQKPKMPSGWRGA